MFQCSSNIHKPLYSIPQKHHQVRRHSPSWHPTLQIHTSHTSSPDLSLANWVACNPYELAGLILATIYSTLSKTHIKLSVLRRKFVLNQVPPRRHLDVLTHNYLLTLNFVIASPDYLNETATQIGLTPPCCVLFYFFSVFYIIYKHTRVNDITRRLSDQFLLQVIHQLLLFNYRILNTNIVNKMCSILLTFTICHHTGTKMRLRKCMGLFLNDL